MHKLTREQKIENYREILATLENKKLNLENQINGVKAKIERQERFLTIDKAYSEDQDL